jgi:hypothetical protein
LQARATPRGRIPLGELLLGGLVLGGILLGVTGALGLLAAPGAAAQEQEEETPPVVPLDQLLRLPTSAPVSASIEKRGGSTKAEWEARFRKARKELESAEAALAETRKELEELAGESGGQWKMSAPGLGGGGATDPTDTPLDYRLSQDLRRQREEVERTRQQLHELTTEADLAGVPEDWRHAEEPAR